MRTGDGNGWLPVEFPEGCRGFFQGLFQGLRVGILGVSRMSRVEPLAVFFSAPVFFCIFFEIILGIL